MKAVSTIGGTPPAGTTFHKLIPFVYSKTEAYHLVLRGVGTGGVTAGDLTIYLFSASGVLTATYIDATTVSFGSTHPFTQAEMDSIQYVQSGDFLFCTIKNHAPIVITRTGTNTFTVGAYTDYTPTLSGDSYGILRRPYRDLNLSAVTIDITDVPGSHLVVGDTITLNAILSAAPYALFDADMVGTGTDATYFKISHAGVTGVCAVRGFTSSSEVTAEVLIAFGANTASADWEESAWSHYRGWPEAIGAYESRLVFGNCDAQRDTIWGSEADDLFNLMARYLNQDLSTDTSGLGYFLTTGVRAVQETDPFTFTPTAREVNNIGWIQSGRSLVVGTQGQEFVAQGSADRILSSGSVNFSDQTTMGSQAVQAIRVNKSTVFVSRDGKRVYNYDFEFLSQSYIVEDLTELAEHIVMQTFLDEEKTLDADPGTRTLSDFTAGHSIKSMHWQPSRQVFWVVTDTGDLIGATWNSRLKTIAWHRHILGGYNDGEFTTRPFVLSAAIVPTENGFDDVLSLLVTRVINGTSVTYLEIMGSDFNSHRLDYSTTDLTDGEAPIFMDSTIAVNLSPASDTVTGLSHLDGCMVDVLYDGKYYERLQVDALSHSLTLKRDASFVLVGLHYSTKLKLPPLDAGSPIGSAQGMMMRVDKVTVRFDRTLDAKLVGPESEEPIDFADGTQPMGEAIPLFSGDKRVDVPMGPERRFQVEIGQDKPLPMTILGIILRGQLNE